MSVVVFGSINLDLTVQVKRLPTTGETLTANSFQTTGGGKGANQAVALARLGIPTSLIGRVGNDRFGQQLKDELAQNQVNIENVRVSTNQSTGIAMIAVEETTGENQIIIVTGANGNVDDTDLANLEKVLATSTYLLLQLEIPLEAVIKAIDLARQYNVKVILDPAPVVDLPEDIYTKIDIITPNTIEVSQLVGFTVDNIEDAKKASLWLLNKGVKTVIITMGSEGVFCATNQKQFLVSAPKLKVVDTVGAGDAFNGGLTMGLSLGYSLKEAVKHGVIASSLSVSKTGVQSSFPNKDEMEKVSFVLECQTIDS